MAPRFRIALYIGSLPGALVVPWIVFAPLEAASFIRGDANQDGKVDISDPKFTLNFLFLGGSGPPCPGAADANDDEIVDISDPIATLELLFLGSRSLPPPFPSAGPDPTRGLGCGSEPPQSLVCRPDGPAVVLTWAVPQDYDGIEVLRDGDLAAALPGDAAAYTDHPRAGGTHDYAVRGVEGSAATDEATCRVAGLPTNRPPTLILTAPAQGTVVEADSVQVRGRVTDDNEVVRIVAAGADATPQGPPPVPYEFTATRGLLPGPNLLRVQAVDDFGRSTFKDVAVGRPPLIPVGGKSMGVALDLSGTTGYDEVEKIVRPFLNQVPALLNQAVAGVELYRGSVLGVDIRVTGNRAEVPGAIGFDLFPSSAGGGRVGLAATFERILLFADGRSDFGFLGTDNWAATFTANNVTIRTTFAFNPLPGGAGLDIVTDGFTVEIGSSSTSVSGFLDPFGIFDGLVNFLAGLFQDEIESQVKAAVQGAAEQQLVPILEDAFSNLKLNLDLADVSLDTTFHDVLESGAGLSLLFDSVWLGAVKDPTFPPFPGSSARLAPYPTFPLAVPVGHAVDATISLSSDTLNQALFELTASGLLSTSLGLADVEAPLPLLLGTLATVLDERLLDLPGVSETNPLGLRVAAELPAEIRLGEGALGRAIVGQGAIWRYFKGTAEPPAGWNGLGFDDSSWERGPSGFGYSSDPGELRSVRTELPDMPGGFTTLYARVAFRVGSPAALTGLLLHVEHDDGFVAYLNGQEVARANATGAPPAFSAVADGTVEPTQLDIDLTPRRALLRAGDNVLAVQGLNAASASSDFVLVPELLEPVAPPAGTLGRVPAVIDVRDLVLTFVADTKGDGVGTSDADGQADEVDLFAYRLDFSLQAALLLTDGGGSMPPAIGFQMLAEDGPDADAFPDAIVGGAQGLRIAVAREAIDMRTTTLIEFAQLVLAILGPSLGEALTGFELPSFPIPELSFDLDSNGVPDVRLDVVNATLAVVDTTGDRRADWVCILSNLRAAAP
ncbi:MAG: hypothetical protein HY721_30080 [Planctomycetes bacterium]|nr:hypothetical protein [Planctomycetota bacterium]